MSVLTNPEATWRCPDGHLHLNSGPTCEHGHPNPKHEGESPDEEGTPLSRAFKKMNDAFAEYDRTKFPRVLASNVDRPLPVPSPGDFDVDLDPRLLVEDDETLYLFDPEDDGDWYRPDRGRCYSPSVFPTEGIRWWVITHRAEPVT